MYILLLLASMLAHFLQNVTVHVCSSYYPLQPAISLYIFQTVLHTFAVVLIRKICLTIKIFFTVLSFSLFSLPLWLIGRFWTDVISSVREFQSLGAAT